MKKLLSLSSLLLVISIQTAYAADSTPSADIKAKLEEFRKEYASKAAEYKELIKKKLQNKAYVGNVKSKSNQSLTLAAKTGPKMVSINQDTVLPKKLTEEDYIAALGDVDETGVLTAKKIVLLKPITEEPKTYLWGQIISISDKLSTLKDRDLKNISLTLPDQPPVKLNDFIIATGRYNKNDIFQAEFVYVIPQGAVLKPKKLATPSAKPKSTKP